MMKRLGLVVLGLAAAIFGALQAMRFAGLLFVGAPSSEIVNCLIYLALAASISMGSFFFALQKKKPQTTLPTGDPIHEQKKA